METTDRVFRAYVYRCVLTNKKITTMRAYLACQSYRCNKEEQRKKKACWKEHRFFFFVCVLPERESEPPTYLNGFLLVNE